MRGRHCVHRHTATLGQFCKNLISLKFLAIHTTNNETCKSDMPINIRFELPV